MHCRQAANNRLGMIREQESIPRPRRGMTASGAPAHGRSAFWWGLGSLCVRLVAWGWAVSAGTRPTFDEPFYFERAQGYADLLARRGPPGEAWRLAYGHGIWPPLHPFLLGVASLIGPNPLASARLLGVLI